MTNSDAGRGLTMIADVNNVIDDLHSSFGLAESDFFCECGRAGCTERLTLTRAEYASLREEARPVLVRAHGEREPSAVSATRGTTRRRAPALRLRTSAAERS